MVDARYPDALAAESRLHWYVLEGVLGQGGFGITYLARDTNLDRAVAIKEFLPVDIALRGNTSVRPRTPSQEVPFRRGLERFIEEARTLARFDHPNIVRVYSVFEANGTAYMVMRFEEGENLAPLLERRGMLSEGELLRIVLPILEGLELIHDAGFIHRDIKPENIHIRRDGSPVLLDFGSARQSLGHAKTMTVLVAPGYAPLEQYHGEAKAQGPWTDIYGLGAMCYRAITGEAPRDAVARAKGILGSSRETLTPAVVAGRGRYSGTFLAAVDHALHLPEADRPQHVGAWRNEILAESPPFDAIAVAASQAAIAPAPMSVTPPVTPRGWPIQRAAIAAGVVASVAAMAWLVPNLSITRRVDAPSQAMPSGPSPTLVAANIATPPAPAATQTLAQALVAASESARTPPKEAPPQPAATLASAKPAAPKPTPQAPPAPVPAPAPAAATATAPAQTQGPTADAAARRGDYATALRTAKTSARSGDANAQLLLGTLHEAGKGTPRSAFEAYVWYSLAARQGQASAVPMRDRVASQLQPAELRQADRLVERWQPATTTISTIATPAGGTPL